MNAGRHGWMAIAALLALASCAVDLEAGRPDDEASQADDEADKIGGDDGDGMQTQGRHLFGEDLDRRGSAERHFAVEIQTTASDGQPYYASIVDGTLHVAGPGGHFRGMDRELVGLVFEGVDGGRLRLGKAVPVRGVGVGHTISIQPPRSDTWEPVCGGRPALPLHGTFGRDGFHHDEPAISFVCPDGGAYKCSLWGYPPGTSSSDPLWDYHQACTRMARNDLCANGQSYTFEGTAILFRDETPLTDIPEPPDTFNEPTTWPPPVDAYFYEAAWRGGRRPPRCLARARWRTLPLGNRCGGLLLDPRVDPDARACEDLLDDDEGLDDVLIFSASHINDVTMNRWDLEGDLVSTINGYFAIPESGQPAEIPFGGLTAIYHGTDGILLRVVPESIDEADLLDLNLYRRIGDGDRVVTTAASVPAGYEFVEKQGFVFEEARERTTPLYQHRRGDRWVTSTLAEFELHQGGEIVGHVFAVPDADPP
jgi:hypothetical protein